MNILIHMGFGFPRGSACANRMRVFYEIFKENGHDVKILAPEIIGIDNNINPDDILICKTYEMKEKTAISRMRNNISFAFSSVKQAKKTGKIDVVITTSPPPLISMAGWWISKKKKAKLVYDVRDIWPDVALEMGSISEGGIYCRIFDFIAKFMYKHADLITTVSPGKVDKIKKKISEKDKVVLVANGIDESFLKNQINDGVVERYHLDGKFNVVYIGNIGLAQGLENLINLAKTTKNENVQFLLFGEGAEKKKLEDVVLENGIDNVKFEGVVGENEVFNVLRHAQLAYVPLVNENLKDSIPTKTYEALAAGCPVLMAAEGDAVDLLNETGYGWSISPSNIQNMPELFEKILTEHSMIQEKKQEAIEHIMTQHSRQNIVRILEKELKKLW